MTTESSNWQHCINVHDPSTWEDFEAHGGVGSPGAVFCLGDSAGKQLEFGHSSGVWRISNTSGTSRHDPASEQVRAALYSCGGSRGTLAGLWPFRRRWLFIRHPRCAECSEYSENRLHAHETLPQGRHLRNSKRRLWWHPRLRAPARLVRSVPTTHAKTPPARPGTCAQQETTCRTVSDGCGGTLNCGPCQPWPKVCDRRRLHVDR